MDPCSLYGVTIPASYDGSHPVRNSTYGCMAAREISQRLASSMPFQMEKRALPILDKSNWMSTAAGTGMDITMPANSMCSKPLRMFRSAYKIDPARIVLRGFSLGGEGAWHLASAESGPLGGSGNWRGNLAAPFTDVRLYSVIKHATLHIYETLSSGRSTRSTFRSRGTAVMRIISPRRSPFRSLERRRADNWSHPFEYANKLAKEGYASEGEPDFLRAKGTPSIFLISLKTAHSTSPLVRQRLEYVFKRAGG